MSVANNVSGANWKNTKGVSSRKAERKADRQNTKQRKAAFFSHTNVDSSLKRAAPVEGRDELEDGRPLKKRKLPVTLRATAEEPVSAKTKANGLQKNRPKKPSSSHKQHESDTLSKWPSKSRIEEEEDAYISMLENRLGVKKAKAGKKKYGSGFEHDGLMGMSLCFYVFSLR